MQHQFPRYNNSFGSTKKVGRHDPHFLSGALVAQSGRKLARWDMWYTMQDVMTMQIVLDTKFHISYMCCDVTKSRFTLAIRTRLGGDSITIRADSRWWLVTTLNRGRVAAKSRSNRECVNRAIDSVCCKIWKIELLRASLSLSHRSYILA